VAQACPDEIRRSRPQAFEKASRKPRIFHRFPGDELIAERERGLFAARTSRRNMRGGMREEMDFIPRDDGGKKSRRPRYQLEQTARPDRRRRASCAIALGGRPRRSKFSLPTMVEKNDENGAAHGTSTGIPLAASDTPNHSIRRTHSGAETSRTPLFGAKRKKTARNT